VAAFLPVGIRSDQAQEQFVRELRRLQGEAAAELAQVAPGDRADLRIDQFGKPLGRRPVAAAPGMQQARDVAPGCRGRTFVGGNPTLVHRHACPVRGR
jgi:hypothetical protein